MRLREFSVIPVLAAILAANREIWARWPTNKANQGSFSTAFSKLGLQKVFQFGLPVIRNGTEMVTILWRIEFQFMREYLYASRKGG
jgi:hypothetical protein